MANILLLLATILCACCAVLSFMPLHPKVPKIIFILWSLSAVLVVGAAALMVYLQLSARFEYQYVYNHISKDMALIYKISALWSGQEGSFLLWAVILGIMGFLVLKIKGNGANRAFGIYTLISLCIYIMCFIVQPFAKTANIPIDGLGLNEALKDPWMVVHPPLVFIAYSAMAVLFSLVATLSKKVNNAAGRQILTWLRVSWFFLGMGIFSGSIWSYRALGWGGYWAWDPIENAALVPWLIMCGYLHRKEYNRRSVCMVPFLLACFGVFLARSGILRDQSLHAYTEGNFIITAIISCFVLGAVLFLVLKNKTGNDPKGIIHKRDLMIYCIKGYAALILIGTLAPIILQVKTPVIYYTAISVIFVLIYNALLLVWDWDCLKKRSVSMIAISTALIIGIIGITSSDSFWWLLVLWYCLMPPSLWLASRFQAKSWKYYLTHLGVVLLVIGAIGSSALGKESYILLNPGSSNVIISGGQIPVTSLTDKDMLIKTLLSKDIVIECSQISSLPQGRVVIPYKVKPLIILFWLGGVLVIISPLLFMFADRFGKAKKFL